MFVEFHGVTEPMKCLELFRTIQKVGINLCKFLLSFLFLLKKLTFQLSNATTTYTTPVIFMKEEDYQVTSKNIPNITIARLKLKNFQCLK